MSDQILADYLAFRNQEQERIGWKCSAPDDEFLVCHVGNVNALYNGSCTRCAWGVSTHTEEVTD